MSKNMVCFWSKLDRDYEIKNIQKVLDSPEDNFLHYYLDKKYGRQLLDEMRSLVGAYTTKLEIPNRIFMEQGITVNDSNVECIEYSFDNQKSWTRISDFPKNKTFKYFCNVELPADSVQKTGRKSMFVTKTKKEN